MTLAAAPSRIDPEVIADQLLEARARTLLLVAPLTDEELHAAARSADEPDPLGPGPHRALRGALAHPQPRRADRVRRDAGALQPVRASAQHARRAGAAGSRRSAARSWTRSAAGCSARLVSADFDAANPLLRDGYVYQMVLQHEYQHNETMLQTLQLKQGAPYRAARAARAAGAAARPRSRGRGEMVRFPGGARRPIGTDDRSAAYDNERPRAPGRAWRRSGSTRIRSRNHDFLVFIARRRVRDAGSTGRRRAGAGARSPARGAPKYWNLTRRRSGRRARMDRIGPGGSDAPGLPRDAGTRPRRSRGSRASGCRPRSSGRRRRRGIRPPAASRAIPWGDAPPDRTLANVDQLAFGTAPLGAYPRERLADRLLRHDRRRVGVDGERLRALARLRELSRIKEYSEVFFGTEYKVLRGGSWATRPGAIRNTFRNWDYPIRRQIFSGFRCARDA